MFVETKMLTYACICSKYQICTATWDLKMESVSVDSIPLKQSGKDRPMMALQAKFCLPSNRTLPVLVVGSNTNALIYDIKDRKIMASVPLDSPQDAIDVRLVEETFRFSRGISCVENFIIVGAHTGELLIFNCSSENNISVKKSLMEHKHPIADVATCAFDLITASVDVNGLAIVWNKNMKTILKKINTGQSVSCCNVLRKQVLIGNFLGQVLFYSVQSGELMAEVNAHSRMVSSIAVAPESAYVLTAGEDSYIRIWKLHTRKPEAYQVEFRHGEQLPNIPISGAQFINGRGSGFAVAAYDYSKLFLYKIAKKPAAVPPATT
uniref:WD_REPEATS_REGION domain-containing protein n=1 Tax=Acrobeloides nanus TaxID=290746 RepID=A0A914CA51_9BILA